MLENRRQTKIITHDFLWITYLFIIEYNNTTRESVDNNNNLGIVAPD